MREVKRIYLCGPMTGIAEFNYPEFNAVAELKPASLYDFDRRIDAIGTFAQLPEAAALAGFTAVYNVLEGFEGELDPLQRRGESGGWRHWGLPWVQD